MVMNYGNYNYGYNQPQGQYSGLFNQQQVQVQQPVITFVSDIAEAIATKPDVTGKPLFFYNVANDEIYKKQYDNTGAAPVKTYKVIVENNTPVANPVLDSIKVLDNKINDIKKLLTPEIIEKGNKKQ